MFAFRFYNNSLATGPRLAGRYRANADVIIDERCAFCVKGGVRVPERELFRHLFYNCSVIQDCLRRYLDKYGPRDATEEERLKFFFTGSATGEKDDDLALNLISNIIFCFLVWRCKTQQRIPTFLTIENNLLTIFDSSLCISKIMSETASTSESSICRWWRARTGRG